MKYYVKQSITSMSEFTWRAAAFMWCKKLVRVIFRNCLFVIFITYLSLSLAIFRTTISPYVLQSHESGDVTRAQCQLPTNYSQAYPNCDKMVLHIEKDQTHNKCYRLKGVDGGYCSIVRYLAKNGRWCPNPYDNIAFQEYHQYAEPNINLSHLLTLLKEAKYDKIRQRLSDLWPSWVQAYQGLDDIRNSTSLPRPKKRILLNFGLLYKGMDFDKKAKNGGPLGDLMQWADLIAALFILGHDLHFFSDKSALTNIFNFQKASCSDDFKYESGQENFDLIYTDIVGLKHLQKIHLSQFPTQKCKVRVLDWFGTQAEFNVMPYYLKHEAEFGGRKNELGGNNLTLPQFYSAFPLNEEDNTFLGFVVHRYLDESTIAEAIMKRGRNENRRAVVYGKQSLSWTPEAKEYLSFLNDNLNFTFYSTTKQKSLVPNFVEKKGVLSRKNYHVLLSESDFLLGLGLPLEGPAALEAIANGVIFINPQFKPPRTRANFHPLAKKPTMRAFTSQNPFAEKEIGEPYVYTADITDKTAVWFTMMKAFRTRITPKIPYMFTSEAMLQRVNFLVENQDFCQTLPSWPPDMDVQIVVAQAGMSCRVACVGSGLQCEYSYFPKMNHKIYMCRKTGFSSCINWRTTSEADVFYPAWKISNLTTLVLQQEPALFSCSAKPPTGFLRVCPCSSGGRRFEGIRVE